MKTNGVTDVMLINIYSTEHNSFFFTLEADLCAYGFSRKVRKKKTMNY